MDPRVRAHADVLVDHATGVEGGDDVLVRAPPVAEDLVVAIAEQIGERGANPEFVSRGSRVRRAYLRASDAEDFETPAHVLAAMEATDVVIDVRGARNTHETGDVPPETISAMSEAVKPVSDAYMDTTFTITQYPAPADAQKAEMSTAAYEDFVYGAVNRDWDEQRAFQQRMVDVLDPADEVRLVSGDTTDVTMSVSGMDAANDYGELNVPGGEVYTCPVPDSVEGEVLFDMPVMRQGREVTGVHLVFEDGEVVEHGAEKNEEVLTSVLETDDGARRVGELGIGMNRDIDRFTYNMLFDEKMGDTVHLALGRSLDWTVPEGREGNDSAVHLDMLVDVGEESYIEVDGERVQEDGTFVFEE